MLSPDLGKKRRCVECEAAFYDLNRDPITCPKCGAVHHPVARLKSDGREPPKGRTFPRRKPAAPAEAGTAAAAAVAVETPQPLEEDLDPAEADDAEDDDEDEDEDETDEQEPEPDPDSPDEGDDVRH